MKSLLKGIVVVSMLLLTACTSRNKDTIYVLTREQGSGTRSAFIEIFEIEKKNDAGEKVDHTYERAEETNSTSVMITTVMGNPNAIGYISLGSLNDDIKAVKIDGVEASVENVKSGAYQVSRPFNIITQTELSEVASDFINFIMSRQGQEIVEETGYVSVGEMNDYVASNLTGKIVVAGSSSLTQVMQKLQEAYMALNKNVTIEVQQSDSTTGINNTIDGLCDIGMASRELKESEVAKGVTSMKMAIDGIAVIVNKENELETLTSEQVTKIFTGEITLFEEVK